MLIGVILVLKLAGKRKHAPFTTISLNKVNLIEMTTWLYTTLFYKKILAVAVLHTWAGKTSVLTTTVSSCFE